MPSRVDCCRQQLLSATGDFSIDSLPKLVEQNLKFWFIFWSGMWKQLERRVGNLVWRNSRSAFNPRSMSIPFYRPSRYDLIETIWNEKFTIFLVFSFVQTPEIIAERFQSETVDQRSVLSHFQFHISTQGTSTAIRGTPDVSVDSVFSSSEFPFHHFSVL